MSDPWKDIREAKRMTPKKLYDLLVDADALLAFLWAWENDDTDEELHVAYNALPSNLRWATKEDKMAAGLTNDKTFGDVVREMRKFSSGATRDNDDGKFDWEGFISPIAMTFFAKYMHQHRLQADGTLRDGDNWQKGIPRRQYMKSLIRHVWDLWRAWRMYPEMEDRMVDLLCAVLFNCQGMLLEIALGRDVQENG